MCGPASRASLPFFPQRKREKGVFGRGVKTRDSGGRRGAVKGASLSPLSFSLCLSLSLSVCMGFISLSFGLRVAYFLKLDAYVLANICSFFAFISK